MVVKVIYLQPTLEMKLINRFCIVIWAVSTFFVSSQSAVAEGYRCSIEPSGDYRWTEGIFTSSKFEEESPVVSAWIDRYNKGQPISVRVRSSNATRIVMTWDVDAIDSAQQRSRMRYTAILHKDTMEMSLMAKPRGYRTRLRGNGTCETRS